MKNKNDQADPFASREAEKYENPIPSREFILKHLEASVGPLSHEELCAVFELDNADAIEALRRRLGAMERDGQAVRNRRGGYGPLDKMNLIKGRVSGHPEGFGFVISSNRDGGDVFLSSRQMRRVFDGDEVVVRITGTDRKGRSEGAIVEVVERRTQQLVGRYFTENGIHFVRPDNPRISQDVLLVADGAGAAEPGQIVVVTITQQPDRRHQAAGQVSSVLGEHSAPGLEIDIAIHNFSIPNSWSEALETEVAQINSEVLEADKTLRVDLRDLPLVTIDGEDARDFDDAVYCQPASRNGWTLYVAIADVSHYVKPGSELDLEAYQRGNSVYFPGQVVPMLPEKLSNGLCSLQPAVDRLCMVCEMRIDASGKMMRFRFYEAIMHSRARLTYTQVASMIEQRGDGDSGVRKQFAHIVNHVDHLHDLYQALREQRDVRGAIDFETTETRILFDADRKIEKIIPTERTEAHRLIEECMLSANVCAATLLEKSQLPALYRVHEVPKEEKLDNLREFLGEIGLSLPGGDTPSPLDYQSVLSQVTERPDAGVIQSVMLRSMRQAVYQDDNKGHFGLNYEAYSHFTSPIRRYADLLVHRAIRGLLRSKKRVAHLNRVEGAELWPLTNSYPYNAEQISEAGSHCSMTERRADDATRSVDSWLKCQYLVDQVGNEFTGVVTSVTGFGLFVQLDDLFIEGLVHITGLPRDYYNFEAAHHRLVGERTRRVFRLGDRLSVIVTRVNVDERKIDFDLVEGSHLGASEKRRRGKSAAKPTGESPAEPSNKGPRGHKKSEKKPASKRRKKPMKKTSASASTSGGKPEAGAKPKKKSKKTSTKTGVKTSAKPKKKARPKSKSNAKRRAGTSTD
ncbi:MAG: ribonuclease R [Gammaproteobacteria bacterium]|nr:ribonuclease R [Gammaproteobacteria bacterium]MBQ0839996.1 ribonuclease R [Gammaproteobacteria bacterium]